MLMLRKINKMKILETERLILRTWDDNDLQPMLAINEDPKVMEYFPELQDLETTKKLIIRINDHFEKYGYTNSLKPMNTAVQRAIVGFEK